MPIDPEMVRLLTPEEFKSLRHLHLAYVDGTPRFDLLYLQSASLGIWGHHPLQLPNLQCLHIEDMESVNAEQADGFLLNVYQAIDQMSCIRRFSHTICDDSWHQNSIIEQSAAMTFLLTSDVRHQLTHLEVHDLFVLDCTSASFHQLTHLHCRQLMNAEQLQCPCLKVIQTQHKQRQSELESLAMNDTFHSMSSRWRWA